MRKIVLLFILLGGLSTSSMACFSFFDSFQTIDPFWEWNSGQMVPMPDINVPFEGHEHCLCDNPEIDSFSLSHQFDDVMEGNISIDWYDMNLSFMYFEFCNSKTDEHIYFGKVIDNEGYHFRMPGSRTPYHIPSDPMRYRHIYPEYLHEIMSNPENYNYIEPTIGWHNFETVFSNDATQFKIDGRILYSVPFDYGFDKLSINWYLWSGGSGYFDDFSCSLQKHEYVQEPVPEPTSVVLLGSGLFGLIGIGRKKLLKK